MARGGDHVSERVRVADRLAVVAVVLAAVGAVLVVSARDGASWRRIGVVGALTVACGLGVLGLRHGEGRYAFPARAAR